MSRISEQPLSSGVKATRIAAAILPLAFIVLIGAHPNAQTLRQITSTSGILRDTFPSISDDGSLMAWQRRDAVAYTHEFLITDTATLKTWTAATTFPEWNVVSCMSGDGSTIAMVKGGDLFVVPTSGGPLRKVTNFNGTGTSKVAQRFLSLSRDGTVVCYEVWDGGPPHRSDLMIMNLTTNQLTTINRSQNPVPDWLSAHVSGDGKTVVYAPVTGWPSTSEIWVAATDGTKLRRLTNFGNMLLFIGPRLDHSGKLAVFDEVNFLNGHGIVHSVRTDGSSLKTLTPTSGSSNRGVRLSADGDRITFFSNRAGNGDVFMAYPDGTWVRRLTNHGTFAYNGVPKEAIALNADGTVAVLASQANVAGGNPERDAEIWLWKDALTRTGAAKPGALVMLNLEDTARPGAAFMVRCAFGRKAGIQIPGAGTLPLTPDALFQLSGQAPAVFRNFSGYLDSAGRATATVAIPNWKELSGFTFFASFITVAPALPVSIYNPLKITIS